MSDKVIQSYVWNQKECFFVSTIERDSSSMLAPDRYYETMVWDYYHDERARGEMLMQGENSVGSIREHQKICERIFHEGRYWDKKEDE